VRAPVAAPACVALTAAPETDGAAAAAAAPAGRVVTFRQYFQEQYKITLKDDSQPLLLVEARRGARRVKIPAELCHVTVPVPTVPCAAGAH
jgi:hypothetical protein